MIPQGGEEANPFENGPAEPVPAGGEESPFSNPFEDEE